MGVIRPCLPPSPIHNDTEPASLVDNYRLNELKYYKQVAQGQYVISGPRYPALHGCKLE